MTEARRSLHLTDEMLVGYSRRGNFHSDPETAAGLGYSGLVAQGMQSVGPVYGLLLDEWGDDFLAHGELEVTFVGVVLGGDTIDAVVELVDDETAQITVTIAGTERTAVVGSATRLGGMHLG